MEGVNLMASQLALQGQECPRKNRMAWKGLLSRFFTIWECEGWWFWFAEELLQDGKNVEFVVGTTVILWEAVNSQKIEPRGQWHIKMIVAKWPFILCTSMYTFCKLKAFYKILNVNSGCATQLLKRADLAIYKVHCWLLGLKPINKTICVCVGMYYFCLNSDACNFFRVHIQLS